MRHFSGGGGGSIEENRDSHSTGFNVPGFGTLGSDKDNNHVS